MRKLPLLTVPLALAGMLAANAASASDLRMTIEAPHFTCEGHENHVSHVAYHPDARPVAGLSDDAPLPCCEGQIGCAQFLSTNTVVRHAHEWHG